MEILVLVFNLRPCYNISCNLYKYFDDFIVLVFLFIKGTVLTASSIRKRGSEKTHACQGEGSKKFEEAFYNFCGDYTVESCL